MIEEAIERNMFSQDVNKSFTDKLLAKDEALAIRKLMRKERLTRQDLAELLNLLSSNEQKLLNYGEWDRYINLKFFVWVRETVKLAELLYDYEDDIENHSKMCKNCELDYNTCKCSNNPKDIEYNIKLNKLNSQNECLNELFGTNYKIYELKPIRMPQITMSQRSKKLFNNIFRRMEHNVKFIVDLYLNISRSTLSLGATGILELLKNKYEVSYPEQRMSQEQPQKGKLAGLIS